MTRRPHLTHEPHTVYRAYDADDRLLYVGCTARSLSRMDQQKASAWWSSALYMTFEHFDNRDEARAAEMAAIDAEGPEFNVRRTGWSPRQAEQVRADVRDRLSTEPTEAVG